MNVRVIPLSIMLVYAMLQVSIAYSEGLDCLIEPYVIVKLSSPVEGLLETVTVDRGDLVKTDQVLAMLESSVEKATVAIAHARVEMEAPVKNSQIRLELSLRKLSRNDGLFKDKIISVDVMDEAEVSRLLAEVGLLEAKENKRLARLDLERATAALEMRTIRSPITGVVVQRFLSPGEFTANETPILKLAQIDPLHVEVFVPVSLLGEVSVGMQAQVTPEAPVNGVHIAKVTVVDRVIDAASGMFGVRLTLPNPNYSLPAGLKCKVLFIRK